ncbi:MAG: hypothetical protein H6566_27975 [Lewinellaceae bacterium]|nr:hypothetical protein [Lewinellaceae bacterium]
MKTILFLLVLLGAIPVFSQSFPSLPAIYASGHIGFFPDDDFHLSTQLGLGYQLNQWVGLGVHIGGYSEFDGYPESFGGGGLSYRAVPGKHLVGRVDLGFAWNYTIPNDCSCETRYIPGGYPFFNTHLGWRFRKAFTLGMSVFYLPGAVVETQWFDFDEFGNMVWEPASRHEYSMSAFQLTFGFNIH